MQILRIILMVCFVFTVYPSIGEAQETGVKIKTGDDGLASKPRLSVTTSTGENSLHDARLHVEGGGSAGENEKSEREAGEPVQMKYRVHGSELIHLNERILQLQKKELDKSLDTSTEDKECLRSYANTVNYTNSVFARVAGSTLSLRTYLSFR